MDDFKENVIEFLINSDTATVTFTQGRYISRIKELANSKPDECKITHINEDGSIVAHIPTTWIRINPNIELSDELKKVKAERMRKLRQEQLAKKKED